MRKTPDEILAAELQKLATDTTGKKVGAGVVGWVARHMPNDAYQTQVQLQADGPTALRMAYEVLQENGQIRDDTEAPPDVVCISGVVRSGFLGLNPALVLVQVVPRDEQHTDLIVTGTAKEGLIKQRAGEKAAKEIAEQLAERVRPASEG